MVEQPSFASSFQAHKDKAMLPTTYIPALTRSPISAEDKKVP